jgi:SpoVK/Ycf46/Vps4 family AAA+-type ATPase
MNQNHDYPVHTLAYLVRLSSDKICAPFILIDEYVFSTYFAAIIQGLSRDNEDFELKNILNKVLPALDISELNKEESLSNLEKQEKLMQIVGNLRSQFSESITTTYVKDFFLANSVYRELTYSYKSSKESCDALKKIVDMMYAKMLLSFSGRTTSILLNLERISDTISLTTAEKRLIEMNLLFSTDIRAAIFRDFLFTITKQTSLFEHFYSTMINDYDIIDKSSIIDVLSESSLPIALGIVNYDIKTSRLSNMSDFWIYAISTYNEDNDSFFSKFIDDLTETKKTFSGAIAKASAIDEELLKEFLHEAYDMVDYVPENKKDEAIGLNVMLYGPQRLDKVGYVAEVLTKLGFGAMKIKTRDAKSSDIPSICYVAQQRVKKLSEDSYPIILVVEKTEQALTKNFSKPAWMVDMFGDGEINGIKDGDLNSDELLLIKNPVPTIWLVNSPSQVTPENIGKFLFHVELKGGSRADRREEVLKVVNEIGLSSDVAVKLSKYYELNVEQIKSAARTVTMLKKEGEEGEANLIHLIGNSQRALDREKMEDLRDSVTKYSLDLLNLGGNMPIEKIIQALKRKTQGTLCLYGPPGTGKTQLAEFIATELDKPLMIKPASELLSMWLGESEKNIAKMFDEAKQEGAILLLDEADSFLRDRAMASKSWEVTQVNELLQKMERFGGLFICATNLFSSLDAAALRRFTFKLEFKALTNEQRLKMLINETGIEFDKLEQAEQNEILIDLNMIKHLTPGDFATVRRQANLLDENLSVDVWLERLNIESKSKLIGLERNGIGFLGGEVSSKSRE